MAECGVAIGAADRCHPGGSDAGFEVGDRLGVIAPARGERSDRERRPGLRDLVARAGGLLGERSQRDFDPGWILPQPQRQLDVGKGLRARLRACPIVARLEALGRDVELDRQLPQRLLTSAGRATNPRRRLVSVRLCRGAGVAPDAVRT